MVSVLLCYFSDMDISVYFSVQFDCNVLFNVTNLCLMLWLTAKPCSQFSGLLSVFVLLLHSGCKCANAVHYYICLQF